MSNNIFRKKSMDRFSSPEQLNDYIKVPNPSVWIILFCVIILLVGMLVWGVFGRFETCLDVVAISQDGETICYVKENKIDSVSKGMTVRIKGERYKLAKIDTSPVQVTDDFDAYTRHVGGIDVGDWVYEAIIDAQPKDGDGVYEAEIVTESVASISFLLN